VRESLCGGCGLRRRFPIIGMRMSFSTNRLGFRNTLGTMSLILRVVQDPARYLSQPLVEERGLADVLAMVWRVLLIAR
jgi:hypothetical protein